MLITRSKKLAWIDPADAEWGCDFMPAREEDKYLKEWEPKDLARLFLPQLPLRPAEAEPANLDDTKNPAEQQPPRSKQSLRTH